MSDKIKYKGYKIKIESDEDTPNPYRDWDQLSDTNFWLRDYDLDSESSGQLGFGGPDEVKAAYDKGEIVYYAPIRAYIHSGITISLGNGYPFNDIWDSGLAGFVYVSKKKAKAEFPNYGGRTLWLACAKIVKHEIKSLDQWLTGDVWWYQIKHKKEKLDSCGGIYGYDYCLKEAQSIVDSYLSSRKIVDSRADFGENIKGRPAGW